MAEPMGVTLGAQGAADIISAMLIAMHVLTRSVAWPAGYEGMAAELQEAIRRAGMDAADLGQRLASGAHEDGPSLSLHLAWPDGRRAIVEVIDLPKREGPALG